ncbi:winged helix-turn-helix transcriptional regulator [Candidatus Woesearchaeota archaeon]|nr:winged helix-turn-helix transcriptional regulator [Candidatus Woesearchaeota archaeon]
MLKGAYNIFFETLGNKNRLMILGSLEKTPKTVGELTKELKLDQTTISHNLRRLYVTGFVKARKRGKNKLYEANKKIVTPLLNLVNYHLRCNCSELCRCRENELREKLRR